MIEYYELSEIIGEAIIRYYKNRMKNVISLDDYLKGLIGTELVNCKDDYTDKAFELLKEIMEELER